MWGAHAWWEDRGQLDMGEGCIGYGVEKMIKCSERTRITG